MFLMVKVALSDKLLQIKTVMNRVNELDDNDFSLYYGYPFITHYSSLAQEQTIDNDTAIALLQDGSGLIYHHIIQYRETLSDDIHTVAIRKG